MKEILAVIRINMMNKTKRALAEAGVSSMTAKECLGRGKGLVDFKVLHGAEQGREEAIALLGQGHPLFPKRLMSIVVHENMVEHTVQTLIRCNQTGKAGDGKIFVLPVTEVQRIRASEPGDTLLDHI